MFGVQGFALLVLMIVGVLSNGHIIRIITNDSLMQTFSNKLLLVIAIADLGVCIVVLPFALITMCVERWIFGRALCTITAFFGELFLRASIVMLSLVVFEKHLNIAHRNLARISKRGISLVIALLWITACMFSLPFHSREAMYDKQIATCKLVFTTSKTNDSTIVFGVIESLLFKIMPCGILLVSFGKIYKVIRRRNKLRVTGENGDAIPMPIDLEQLRLKTDQYTTCTMLLLVLQSVILTIPSLVAYGYVPFILEDKTIFTLPAFKIFAFWCMLINHALRPLIYGLRNQRLRKHVKRFLQRVQQRFMVKGCCLASTRRARAYVIPRTEIIELKPGAFESMANDFEGSKTENRPTSSNDVITMGITTSPVFAGRAFRPIIFLGNEDIILGNVTSKRHAAPQHGLTKCNDGTQVEDIEVSFFDENGQKQGRKICPSSL